jgi:thiol:disulfide interchange protein DsbA
MRKLAALVALFCLLSAGLAGAQELREGRDYDVISPAQPTEVAGKIEVTEFFSYMCPHCAHFEPTLGPWVKALPKDVFFRRIPVIFRPQWEATAKLYYTLEAMGELDRLHGAVFEAIHGNGTNLMSDAAVIDWAASKGIDRKKFSDAYNSFTVQSKAGRAKQMQASFRIPGVPALVVGGKYRTPDNFPGSQEDLLKLVDGLIAKVRRETGKK